MEDNETVIGQYQVKIDQKSTQNSSLSKTESNDGMNNGDNNSQNSGNNQIKCPKPRMSNKERAKKARERKKKYYDELEQKVGHYEELLKKMAREVHYYQHKCRLYELAARDTSSNLKNIEVKMVDGMIEKLNLIDSDDIEFIDTLHDLSEGYSALGEEKLKVLENSFDMFLESILIGTDFKAVFYAADKELPQTFADCQSYLKMKKFQKFEKFPDEKLRDFLNTKLPLIEGNEEYNNFILNKMPLIKALKEEMREGISKLFEGKEIVYKALMKQDIA